MLLNKQDNRREIMLLQKVTFSKVILLSITKY